MWRLRNYLLLLTALFTFILLGCNENLNDENSHYYYNNNNNFPAVGNTANAFAFAVTAYNFSFSEKYPVTFNSNSIILGLTVTNFGRGNGRLDFINSGDTVYYSVPLRSNIAYGNKEVTDGTPKWIEIELSNFSGQLSIGVAAN